LAYLVYLSKIFPLVEPVLAQRSSRPSWDLRSAT
jgi:hypothetical protein